jgi:DNA-binding NtrC family response regulator
MADRKIKILIVDDEKIIRDFLMRLFSLQGLEVLSAEDGYKAIELTKSNGFDLFFIDMRMPGLNGLETYLKIKEINPKAQAVMITGYAVEDLLEEAVREGAIGIIRKPFDIVEIKDVIDKLSKEKAKGLLNILIIDDEEIILSFFSNFLKTKSLNFKVARNKDEALSAVKKEKFNLIFLDLVLKEISGMQLYKEIKEVAPDSEVVLMTGYPQKAKEAGCGTEFAGCLYKPFDIDNIIGYIDKAKNKSAK